jgi:hypothetical protein
MYDFINIERMANKPLAAYKKVVLNIPGISLRAKFVR